MKYCTECKRDRFPEGGIFLTATRWICAECWLKFLDRMQKQMQSSVKEAA